MTAKKKPMSRNLLWLDDLQWPVLAPHLPKIKGRKAQRRSADHQRHHSCAAIGLPLAGLSVGLRSVQDDLQSFSPLGEQRSAASNFP
jgi:hypothetical protein